MNLHFSTFWLERRPRDKLRLGFTLVELLVVICIIALLAAILLPVFGRVRENARRTSCSNNMHNFGLAILQYLGDNDGVYPGMQSPGTTASVTNYMASNAPRCSLNEMQGYIKDYGVLICPSSGRELGTATCPPPTALANNTYYENGMVTGRKEVVIPNVSEIVYFQESQGQCDALSLRPCRYPDMCTAYACHTSGKWTHWRYSFNGIEKYSNRHFDGGNLLFTDGHVKFRPWKSLESTDFGLADNGQPPGTGNGCFDPLF